LSGECLNRNACCRERVFEVAPLALRTAARAKLCTVLSFILLGVAGLQLVLAVGLHALLALVAVSLLEPLLTQVTFILLHFWFACTLAILLFLLLFAFVLIEVSMIGMAFLLFHPAVGLEVDYVYVIKVRLIVVTCGLVERMSIHFYLYLFVQLNVCMESLVQFKARSLVELHSELLVVVVIASLHRTT